MKNVTIVGLGALGSHAILFLRNLDAKLKGIDFDRIEMQNSQSQMHLKMNVGKGKAQSLAQSMQLFFGLKIDVVPHKLTKDNVNQILAKSVLIIDAVDNIEARKLISTYARTNNVPCLHGALAPNGGFGRVVWNEKFVPDSEAGVGGATCENGEHLPFITIVASYLARSTQLFLSEGAKVGYEISPGGSFRT